MQDVIRMRHITKSYSTGSERLVVLDDLNLTVQEGEFLAITGQSGSGKSTLMNIIGCLDKADSGSYCLDHTAIESCSEKELSAVRSRKISFVFQSFNLIPSMSALENVALPLVYRGVRRSEREAIAAKALQEVGLSHRMHHLPGQMSGGQQQRTAIARAIAASPRILLADEPTGSLDSRSGEEILSVLRQMNRHGVTVIMITHDRQLAEMADRQLHICH